MNLLGATTLGLLALAQGAPTAKRGVVANGCGGPNCTDGALLGSLGWYYDCNTEDPWYGSSVVNESIKFAPMHWCIEYVHRALRKLRLLKLNPEVRLLSL